MSNTETIEKQETSTTVQLPKLYKVILHNDDTTSMDFVISVLTTIFHRTFDESIELTFAIHITGQGIAGAPYTREIAEEKTTETVSFARANGFPLVATFEEL